MGTWVIRCRLLGRRLILIFLILYPRAFLRSWFQWLVVRVWLIPQRRLTSSHPQQELLLLSFLRQALLVEPLLAYRPQHQSSSCFSFSS